MCFSVKNKEIHLNICMLRNFSHFCCHLLTFSKLIFFSFKQYFISEFTSIIQYILMYSVTGYDSELKLIFKPFPITMWIIQKLYENVTGNQCTLSNINNNAWQIERKEKNMWGGGGREWLQVFLVLRIEHGG